MDFDLDEDDQLLRDTVRQLCEQSVRPHAGEWDEARAIPAAVRDELGRMGLWALRQPEDEGGAGLSTVTACALVEELAAADGALAMLIAAHNFAGLAHVAAASASQPALAGELSAMASGQRPCAWALAEGALGSGEGALAITATRQGDAWALDGEARHVLGAAVAGRFVVFARAEDGPTAFLIDADAGGLHVSAPLRTHGARAAGTAHLGLQGVRVPDERRLGAPGRALTDAATIVALRELSWAAVACGLLRGALQQASGYAQQREQFGRPIASFQAIQWKLADMATGLEAAWLLTVQAAWRCDQGRPLGEAAARARTWATGAAVRGCSEALQIHGGYGYTREYPVERALRDARQLEATAGGSATARSVLADAIAERLG
ncbi:acyl-CoA dehydrogenase family protein [Paraliomyxa miuraensis]|uniref:acyl-CoA dehydrogenase family protein n=1 Tax=Paraliomyxa miuraensis TaxID=376150 RepID=UPI002250D8EC|nr:acyl-CoA dehydrogenase family protein [Paraliomyxa miuraensis]MCX4244674.1 acyl-CoA dehydrogenase family protein [Paraliomyxa miuraensis]